MTIYALSSSREGERDREVENGENCRNENLMKLVVHYNGAEQQTLLIESSPLYA